MITPQTGDLRSPGISTNYSMGESSKYLYQLEMGETKGAGPTNGCWFSRFYTNNFDPFPTASGFLQFPWLSSGDARYGGERINIWIRWNPINHPPKWVVEPIPGKFTARWLWVSNKDWDWDDSSGSTKGFRSLWVSSPKGSPQLWQVRAMWKRPNSTSTESQTSIWKSIGCKRKTQTQGLLKLVGYKFYHRIHKSCSWFELLQDLI